MKEFTGFMHGLGIGGWLTNYKRFHVLPKEWRLPLSPGDFEHFDRYITKRDVDYIASLGADHIRVCFDQLVLEEAPGKYRERIFELLENFAQWCQQAGVNVVFNMHKAIGNYCDISEDITLLESEELQERFIAFWCKMEQKFQHRPQIAFELLNEVKDVPPDLWNNLAKRTIKALRKLNSDRRIIVGSTGWNNLNNVQFLDGYDDDIIFTWHFYYPYEFTHQRGVLHASPLYYNREMHYPGDIAPYNDYFDFVWSEKNHYQNYTRMDRRYLADLMQPVFDYSAQHPERIIWCGEFGTIRHAPLASRENYMSDVISLLLEHDTPYCLWNYLSTPNDGNRFSLVDDDKREILSPKFAKLLSGKVL